MAYNIPSYDTSRISLGQSIVYMGLAGATPTTDVGAVRAGASIAITRNMTDVNQGTPATLIARFVPSETAVITLTGIEWNLTNFIRALGAGSVTTSGTEETLKFGGSITVTDVSLKLVHQMPAGGTVEVDIWKANGDGTLTLPFSEDVHEFAYSFNAILASTDWASNVLSEDEQLLRIVYTT